MTIEEIKQEVAEHALHPLSGDLVMAAFYKATKILLDQDDRLLSLIKKINSKRQMSSEYFNNLLLRAVQNVVLFSLDANYPLGFESQDRWTQTWNEILEKHSDRLIDLIVAKDTKTTVPERYLSLRFLAKILFPHKSIIVADLGCGLNLGLDYAFLTKHIVLDLKDHTAAKLVLQILSSVPSSLKVAHAVDRENPSDFEVKKWELSCRYPNELINVKTKLQLIASLPANQEKIKFINQDLSHLEEIWENKKISPHSCDIVFVATAIYQMPPKLQSKIILQARNLLNSHGVLVVQDFGRIDPKNPENLTFKASFAQPFSYRTFITSQKLGWKFKEIFRWSSGRCREVMEGSDWNDFAKDIKL